MKLLVSEDWNAIINSEDFIAIFKIKAHSRMNETNQRLPAAAEYHSS